MQLFGSLKLNPELALQSVSEVGVTTQTTN